MRKSYKYRPREREQDAEQLREDDWNVEEVDEVLEEDYVVHVDNAHTAPPPGPETLDDLELDVGPHDQQEPCFKYCSC